MACSKSPPTQSGEMRGMEGKEGRKKKKNTHMYMQPQCLSAFMNALSFILGQPGGNVREESLLLRQQGSYLCIRKLHSPIQAFAGHLAGYSALEKGLHALRCDFCTHPHQEQKARRGEEYREYQPLVKATNPVGSDHMGSDLLRSIVFLPAPSAATSAKGPWYCNSMRIYGRRGK